MRLNPGDVLSYSSGSHDRGPYGFRPLRSGRSFMPVVQQRWPHMLDGFADHTPMVINGYPASIGTFDFAVRVDTYLSHSTASRSLHLAAVEGMPVFLLGQPLYVADLLYKHISKNPQMPDTMVIGVGGYVMPQSLERALRDLCAPYCKRFGILQGYGVAEVDAGCMVAVERDAQGQLIYYPRDDARVDIDGEKLLLSLSDGQGGWVIERFDTEDCAKPAGEGFVIWNHDRLHPHVLKIMESWSSRDWERRTGYLYFGRELRFQLRKHVEPESAVEAEHYDYGKRYGQDWLFKPVWSRAKDTGDKVLRRTIL